MVFNENFPEILKDLLAELGLNQKQFAIKIGVDPAQVSEWLHGKNKPGYDSLKAICKACDVSADFLLGLKDY